MEPKKPEDIYKTHLENTSKDDDMFRYIWASHVGSSGSRLQYYSISIVLLSVNGLKM